MMLKDAIRIAWLIRTLDELTPWRKTASATPAEYPFVCFETVYAVTAWQDWSGTDAGVDGPTIPREIVLAMLDHGIATIKAELRELGVKA